MKKMFLVGAIALFGALNAQTFGLKAGLNVASVNEDDTKSRLGFNAGLFMNAPIAPSFSIQPELLYNSKGAKFDGPGDISVALDYISIPVMFQYNATPMFYLEAGPELGFLVNANGKADGVSVDVKDSFETFDIGIGLGAGYFFTPQIGLTARYVAGISDIAKDNGGDAVRNNVFQVGLAYKFTK